METEEKMWQRLEHATLLALKMEDPEPRNPGSLTKQEKARKQTLELWMWTRQRLNEWNLYQTSDLQDCSKLALYEATKLVVIHSSCNKQPIYTYHMPTFLLHSHEPCFRRTELTTCHLDPVKIWKLLKTITLDYRKKPANIYWMLSMYHIIFYIACVCVFSFNLHNNPNYLTFLCLTSPNYKIGIPKAPILRILLW